MHHTALSSLSRLIPATVILLGCQPQDQAESSGIPLGAVESTGLRIAVEPARTLYPEKLLAVPDTTPESQWLSVVVDMRHDAARGTIFMMDRMAGTLAEVDTLGTLIHLYGGGVGQGPHEVRDLADYSFSPSSVVFLDRGNTKVMVYPRLGSRVATFPVPAAYRSIALRADETILLAPGIGSHAVDVYSAAGDLVGGIGTFEALPVRCAPEEDCERRTRRMCLGCVVRVVAEAILIMNTQQDLLTIFGEEGQPPHRLDLRARIPRLREWIAMDEPHLARVQERVNTRSGGGTVPVVLKSYFGNVHASPDGRLAFSINPAMPVFQESGFQYWLLDIETLEVEGAMFSDPSQGIRATGWPTVYGVQRGTYAIYRLEG